MESCRRLPLREQVFVTSLKRHGYRFVSEGHRLKKRKRYIIPASAKDDADGIDFWVKPEKTTVLIPVQVTQRGTRLYQKYHALTGTKHEEFAQRSISRLSMKRLMCRYARIAFILVRDHDGTRPSTALAWGDVKALRNGIRPYL